MSMTKVTRSYDHFPIGESYGWEDAAEVGGAERPNQPSSMVPIMKEETILKLLLKMFDFVLLAAAGRYGTYMALIRLLGPKFLDSLGRARAERLWHKAAKSKVGVPAWRSHRAEAVISGVVGEPWPETDKVSYVNRYPFSERCWGGVCP